MSVGNESNTLYYYPSNVVTRLVLEGDYEPVTEIDFDKLVITEDKDNHIRSIAYDSINVLQYDLTTSYSLPDGLGTVTRTVTHDASEWI